MHRSKVFNVPFIAKCVSCGYILMANTKPMLNVDMEEHDRRSHKCFDSRDFEFCTWRIAVLTHAQYYMVLKASENPAFWRIIRSSPKIVNPLFSGLRSGEFRLF